MFMYSQPGKCIHLTLSGKPWLWAGSKPNGARAQGPGRTLVLCNHVLALSAYNIGLFISAMNNRYWLKSLIGASLVQTGQVTSFCSFLNPCTDIIHMLAHYNTQALQVCSLGHFNTHTQTHTPTLDHMGSMHNRLSEILSEGFWVNPIKYICKLCEH